MSIAFFVSVPCLPYRRPFSWKTRFEIETLAVKKAMILMVLISLVLKTTEGAELPADWQTFIDPDILKRDLGQTFVSFAQQGFYQGDINGVSMTTYDDGIVSAANVLAEEQYRWLDGVVPYNISNMFPEREKSFIKAAMNSISDLTSDCITFVERKREYDHIRFIRGVGCNSKVGRQMGPQEISLHVGCLKYYGSIQHEIMHALGFYHEMTREDRDDHVSINWANINEGDRKQFDKQIGDTFGIPYDYESVMHYPFNAFAKDNNFPTMIPKIKRAKIGQNRMLSESDILRIKKAYRCISSDKTEPQVAVKSTVRISGSVVSSSVEISGNHSSKKFGEETDEPESNVPTTESTRRLSTTTAMAEHGAIETATKNMTVCGLDCQTTSRTRTQKTSTSGRRDRRTTTNSSSTTDPARKYLTNFPLRCGDKRFRIESESHNYKYVYAVKECARSGGRLIRMNTYRQCVLQQNTSKICDHWLGLRRIGNDRYDFIWSDGKMLQKSDYVERQLIGNPWNSDNGEDNRIQTGVTWSCSASRTDPYLSDCCRNETTLLNGYMCEWIPTERKINVNEDVYPMQCHGRYFYIKVALLTYAKATVACTVSGGILMKLDKRKKVECVEQNIRNAGKQGSDFWFGLLRLDHNIDDFIWTDGTLFNSGYEGNWADGVAPPPPINRTRTAIFMKADSNLAWDEQDSSTSRKGYICEAV